MVVVIVVVGFDVCGLVGVWCFLGLGFFLGGISISLIVFRKIVILVMLKLNGFC